MRLKGKKILIVGLARTGTAVARYLHPKGAKITVTDLKTKTELQSVLKPLSLYKGIQYKLGGHPLKVFLTSDLIIVSPGAPTNLAPLERAQSKHIPVMSELEFSARLITQPIIAVTGTNGKTTTTMMIGQMLRNADKSAFVGGNIGNPLINAAASREKYQAVVAEVSSFQLELASQFHPKIAMILNLAIDHLDRHENMEKYAAFKARIFQNQKAADTLILNGNDPHLKGFQKDAPSRVLLLKHGGLDSKQEGIYYKDDYFILKSKKWGKEKFDARRIKVKGQHNQENFMAAILAAKLLKCNSKAIQQTLDTFEGVPHRMEYVKTRGYVDFYNDSKATNLHSVQAALASFDKPLILIMGGRDKGARFEELRPMIQKKVKILILMGEAKSVINRAIGDYTETFVVGTLEEAAFMAYQKSRAGDVVLFSPGCSSYDEFKNYEERGDRFKDLLRDL